MTTHDVEILKQVRTPLALAALVLLLGAPILQSLIRYGRPNADTGAVIKYGFALALTFGVLSMAAFVYTASFTREIRISGTVRDETGKGLPQVDVSIVGCCSGTTNDKGEFAFTIPDSRAASDYVAEVFRDGYMLQKVPLKGRAPDPFAVKLVHVLAPTPSPSPRPTRTATTEPTDTPTPKPLASIAAVCATLYHKSTDDEPDAWHGERAATCPADSRMIFCRYWKESSGFAGPNNIVSGPMSDGNGGCKCECQHGPKEGPFNLGGGNSCGCYPLAVCASSGGRLPDNLEEVIETAVAQSESCKAARAWDSRNTR